MMTAVSSVPITGNASFISPMILPEMHRTDVGSSASLSDDRTSSSVIQESSLCAGEVAAMLVVSIGCFVMFGYLV